MRERSEIEADLAVAVEPSPSDDAAYLTWHEAVLNLFEDVPALLAELDEVRAESERLRSSRSVELIDEQAAEIKRLVEMWKEAQSKENYEHGRVEEVRRERNAARVERDRAVAQVQELTLRIATAQYWIDRRLSKWDSLTVEHQCIQDGLRGEPGPVRDEVAAGLARRPAAPQNTRDRWTAEEIAEYDADVAATAARIAPLFEKVHPILGAQNTGDPGFACSCGATRPDDFTVENTGDPE